MRLEFCIYFDTIIDEKNAAAENKGLREGFKKKIGGKQKMIIIGKAVQENRK